MVMLIIIFWWAVFQWANHPKSYKWAIIAGLFGGFAIYVKFVAAFFVIAGGLGSIFKREPILETIRRPQVYVMTALGILPGAAYAIYGVWIAGYLGQQFDGRFIPSLFLSPSYYFGWIEMLNNVIGSIALTLGLIGLFFFDNERRRVLLGLWAGYALFGIFFNYHISSHDYYSLPLIPIVALSLAPLADSFLAQLSTLTTTQSARITIYCFLFFGVCTSLLNTRAEMKSVDYRPQAQMWAEVGEKIGDKNTAGLTQDYGSRLAYWGWKNITSWPTYGDLIYHDDLRGAKADFEGQFESIALKKELFVVTDFDELNRQPLLKEKLATFAIFAKSDDYVIYNLSSINSQ